MGPDGSGDQAGGSSEAFMATSRAEVARWRTFIVRTKIKLE
jgi:hypothetical protein